MCYLVYQAMQASGKKIKVELEDSEGKKYNICLQGRFSKDKIAKILQLIDSFESSISQPEHDTNLQQKQMRDTISLGDLLWNLIIDNLADKNFSSSDLSRMYRKTYNQDIYLSIVSTYLARFFARGKLHRMKHKKEWMYSLARREDHTNTLNNGASTTQYNVVSPVSRDCDTMSISTVYDLRQ